MGQSAATRASAAGRAFAIDLPLGFGEDRGWKFLSGCTVKGRVVAVPYDAEKILVVDPTSREAFAVDLPLGLNRQLCDKFASSCAVNGRVVAVPYNAKKILVVDPTSCEAFAMDLPLGFREDMRWTSSYAVNGRVVAVPDNAEKILVVDPTSREAFAIDWPLGFREHIAWKFSSSCTVNGRVVAVPHDAGKILVVDPTSREAFAIDLPVGFNRQLWDKFLSSCAVNGRVVAVPCHAEKILVVDPTSGEAFAIDLPLGLREDRSYKFRTTCAVNGRVVAVPYNAEKILVVDPTSREAFAIDLPLGLREDRSYKFRTTCEVNGRVVAVPCNAEKILVVDPTSREAFAIDLPLGFKEHMGLKFSSSCTVNGRVVAVPHDARKILVVDPTSREAFAIDLPFGFRGGMGWKFVSSCAVNGRVVAVPHNAETIVVVDVPKSFALDLHTSDAHDTSEFVELVAAMLSSWVYTDDPAPPEMAHATFEVHAVIQPGDLGRSVKIACVTAHLPLGPVLFVVFKGTSYILDFLNWNLEHDHDITGETDFFAHSGTASTIRNVRFLKSDTFLKRMVDVGQQGVQKVVFTGHSLGGTYAQMSLFLAWKERRRGTGVLSEILSSIELQSFTFGAPMVFGGNSQKAREFKEFARTRAVNYIHANDPCPRAWGALNLRSFIKQATIAVKKGLQDSHGSIMGTVAAKVVEGMANLLLERPDFNLIEDLARKYDHVVPLKVLSKERQHFRWREFQLTPECLEDHSVVAYVNRLFDAFDSSRPECYVHHQASWIFLEGSASGCW